MAKILIIEDDELLIKTFRIKLELEGFEVTQALDGEEGLQKFQEEKPDLVLLDLAMPRMDGFEFMEKLNAMPGGKEVPVVVFTNLSQEQDIEKAKNLGVVDYLTKVDLTPQQVVDKVKEYL